MAKNKRVALQLFTTLVKPLILTGTDFGVDICFGSGLAELKSFILYEDWLSLPSTGLGCSAGCSPCFKNSRFLWSILLSELDFTS